MLWFKALAFQNEIWKEGQGPWGSGTGQLNPFCVSIRREFFVDFGVKGGMINAVCNAELLVPRGVAGVRSDLELNQCVVVEHNPTSPIIRAEVLGDCRVFRLNAVDGFLGDHLESCGSSILVSVEVDLDGGVKRRGRG